jgi:hypothetical protein
VCRSRRRYGVSSPNAQASSRRGAGSIPDGERRTRLWIFGGGTYLEIIDRQDRIASALVGVESRERLEREAEPLVEATTPPR